MQRRADPRKIGICDGGSNPRRDFRERLDSRELGKEFFLMANEPVIFSAMSSLKSFRISSVFSDFL